MSVNWNRRAYTKEEFTEAWNSSASIAQCARKLGLTIYGNTYPSLKEAALELNLNNKHMTGQGWNKGSHFNFSKPKVPIHDLFKEDIKIQSSNFKKRLIEEGFFEEKCSAPYCPLSNPSVNPFTGEPTPLKLSLDHIDGNHRNNLLSNLRLLCYHCHGETETWCGKSKEKKKNKLNSASTLVCGCGNRKLSSSIVCAKCKKVSVPRKTKIEWPSDEALLEMLKNSNLTKIGFELGVSGNAIKKRLVKKGKWTGL
jgi:hypothetical protein